MEGLTNVNDICELFWGNPRRKAGQGAVLSSSSAASPWSALCFLLLGIITLSLSSVKPDSANPDRVSHSLFVQNNALTFPSFAWLWGWVLVLVVSFFKKTLSSGQGPLKIPNVTSLSKTGRSPREEKPIHPSSTKEWCCVWLVWFVALSFVLTTSSYWFVNDNILAASQWDCHSLVVYCKVLNTNIGTIAPCRFSEYPLFCSVKNGGCIWLWTKSGLVTELIAQDRCKLRGAQMMCWE